MYLTNITDDLLAEHHVLVKSDNAFQRRARLLQALWREERGLPMGLHRGAPLGSRIESAFARDTLANFLTPNIRDVVRHAVLGAGRSTDQLIDEERLFSNLLSSQPLCFNLFGEVALDLELATRVVRELAPGRVERVREILFEHSPGRGDLRFTGDRSAFDVFVVYDSPEGKRGFLGIEVKYHEGLGDAAATHKPRYDEVADAMGCFPLNRDALRASPLQQIWRRPPPRRRARRGRGRLRRGRVRLPGAGRERRVLARGRAVSGDADERGDVRGVVARGRGGGARGGDGRGTVGHGAGAEVSRPESANGRLELARVPKREKLLRRPTCFDSRLLTLVVRPARSIERIAAMTRTWMVRAGRGGTQMDEFIEQGFVAIDFSASLVGDLSRDVTKDEILTRLTSAHPSAKPGRLQVWASQVFRFFSEISVGDRVVTSDPGRRRFLLGEITSEPRFEGERYCRRVRWAHRVSRDALALPSLNTLGSALTLFLVPDEVVENLDAHRVPLDAPEVVEPVRPPPNDIAAQIAVLMQEVVGQAESFIEDQISRLDPYEVQDLVAGILRAMGYKTRVSGPGADRGVDVFASPDGLGLEEPRIFVEVKHRNTPMGSQALRSFLGGRQLS